MIIPAIFAATQLERTIEGVPIILLMTVGVIVALFWVFLPVVVWGKLNEIIRLLREIRDNTDGPRRPESSVKYKAGGN
jgi:hypothetical protein